MVEPLNTDPDDAVALAEAIEQLLADSGVRIEQVHYGDGIASWAVNRRAVARGHGIRTGLEDTPVLPDGRIASGNGELVAAALASPLKGRTAQVTVGRGREASAPAAEPRVRDFPSRGSSGYGPLSRGDILRIGTFHNGVLANIGRVC
jgi:hypothetical protein